MKVKKFFITMLSLLVMLVIITSPAQTENQLKAVSYDDLPEGVYAQILPRVELLSGVLAHTSWMEISGPGTEGNYYFQDLKEFFAEYDNHEAIELAEKLTDRNFTYDAPPGFILTVGALPEMELRTEYSDYLINRADNRSGILDSLFGPDGEEILEDFRKALKDLAEKSEFAEFYEQYRSEYYDYLEPVMDDFDAEQKIEWMTDFSGLETENEFYTILAPAMFPGGGYGPSVTREDGRQEFYQVIRARGTSLFHPEFPVGKEFKLLTLHEWGHSFIDPAVDEYREVILDELIPLYEMVEEEMEQQAYGTPMTFFQEQILRAVTTVAAGELYGEEAYEHELKMHTQRAFHLTELTVEQIEKYVANRDDYDDFAEFIPIILDEYKKHLETL